jgi:hypothetical protein
LNFFGFQVFWQPSIAGTLAKLFAPKQEALSRNFQAAYEKTNFHFFISFF